VTFSGTSHGSTAVVTCAPGLYADNGDQNMTVKCRATGQWSFPNPGCSSWSKGFIIFSNEVRVILLDISHQMLSEMNTH